MIKQIKKYYIPDRLSQVDSDFLSFEEEMISSTDQERILTLLNNNMKAKISNPYNSIILYICGLSNEFNFQTERSETIDGSPPDIDIDHDALEREKAIEWAVEYWGRDQVANIITHGTFKPKSLARSYYRVTEGPTTELSDILKMIPPPKYGREATLEEITTAHPELKEDKTYDSFYSAAEKLENMVSNFGIHAAGIVISNFPISDVVPTWKNGKADLITQFDKNEVEELGLIKFDFLGIDTLSIIKEALSLIKQEKDLEIDPYAIEDEDPKTYTMMEHGLLTGVFQMETSGMAKRLIKRIKPKNINELSDISALNRPGPLQAQLDEQYILNKNNGYPPDDLPSELAKVLEGSYWTLVYQEQVMAICSDLAGFTEKESDDIRRAMGKKDAKVLNAYKEKFLKGISENGALSTSYSEDLWESLVGFADYCLEGSTRILTIENGPVSVREIVENKQKVTVLSVDQDDMIVAQEISQWHNNGHKDVYRYTLSNELEIICTEDHKFMTEDGEMKTIDDIYSNDLSISVKKLIYLS